MAPRAAQPQLVEAHQLGSGVAAELLAALPLLQLVRECGQGSEPDATALLAGADRQSGAEVRLGGSAVTEQDHRAASSIQEPLGQRRGSWLGGSSGY
jgi:hypothetical protein